MSKISIKPSSTGTGTYTIEAPTGNLSKTLVLPDSDGMIINEPEMKNLLNVSGTAPMYVCRAWVNFDGTTTPPTIRASGNVSSVVRNATGDFTVTFITAMEDVDYVVSGTLESDSTTTTGTIKVLTQLTGSVRFYDMYVNAGNNGLANVKTAMAIHR